MRQIILDTETTGLEVKQGHRIIEIGCVELENRRKTNQHFHHSLHHIKVGLLDDMTFPKFIDR